MAVAVLGAFVGSSQAALLAPGGTLFPAPTVAAPTGALLASVTSPVVAATFTGTLTSRVYAADSSSTGLIFTYQYTDLTGTSVERITTDSNVGAVEDAGYVTGSGVGAAYIDRSSNGEVVGFSFASLLGSPGPIPPGSSSDVMVVRTTSNLFYPGLASVIDGSVATVASFTPAPVPEPTTLGVAALASMALVRRRRA